MAKCHIDRNLRPLKKILNGQNAYTKQISHASYRWTLPVISEFFNYLYLKIQPFCFWLGWPASLSVFCLGFGCIRRGTSIRNIETEGFADIHLSANKRSNKFELSAVFDAAYGVHFSQHGFG